MLRTEFSKEFCSLMQCLVHPNRWSFCLLILKISCTILMSFHNEKIGNEYHNDKPHVPKKICISEFCKLSWDASQCLIIHEIHEQIGIYSDMDRTPFRNSFCTFQSWICRCLSSQFWENSILIGFNHQLTKLSDNQTSVGTHSGLQCTCFDLLGRSF